MVPRTVLCHRSDFFTSATGENWESGRRNEVHLEVIKFYSIQRLELIIVSRTKIQAHSLSFLLGVTQEICKMRPASARIFQRRLE
jgi:hypothetical protein